MFVLIATRLHEKGVLDEIVGRRVVILERQPIVFRFLADLELMLPASPTGRLSQAIHYFLRRTHYHRLQTNVKPTNMLCRVIGSPLVMQKRLPVLLIEPLNSQLLEH